MKKQRQAWNPEEDALLISVVARLGPHSWASIASVLKSRSPSQCSDRWRTQLAPGISKGSWTPAEDAMILESEPSDSGRWSALAARLPGRSRHAVKNRYNTLMRAPAGGPKPHERSSSRRGSATSGEQQHAAALHAVGPFPLPFGHLGAASQSSLDATAVSQSDTEDALHIDADKSPLQGALSPAPLTPPPVLLHAPPAHALLPAAVTSSSFFFLPPSHSAQSATGPFQILSQPARAQPAMPLPAAPFGVSRALYGAPPADAATTAHEHALACAQLRLLAGALVSGQQAASVLGSLLQPAWDQGMREADALLQQQLAWMQRMRDAGFPPPAQPSEGADMFGFCWVGGHTSGAEINELMGSALGSHYDSSAACAL